MPAATYWRVRITGTSGNFAAVGEIEMKSAFGGADLCTGGTAFSSSNWSASYLPANAFDNNISNAWHSANGSVLPQHIGYQFPAPVDIIEISIRARGDGENGVAPRAWTLEYSNDGITYTPLFSMSGQPAWTTSELRNYRYDSVSGTGYEYKGLRVNTQYAYVVQRGGAGLKVNTQYAYLVQRGGRGLKVNTQYAYLVRKLPVTPDPDPSELRRYWRLLITRDQRILGAGNYYCNIAELSLLADWDAEVAYTGATFTSSGNFGGYPPSNAFDNNDSTTWSGDMNIDPASNPRWLQVDFGSPVAIFDFCITAWDTSAPRDFKLQWSNDGVTWTTFSEAVNQTGWSAGMTRCYNPLTHPPIVATGRKPVAQIIG
jgi:hypothetical protein